MIMIMIMIIIIMIMLKAIKVAKINMYNHSEHFIRHIMLFYFQFDCAVIVKVFELSKIDFPPAAFEV